MAERRSICGAPAGGHLVALLRAARRFGRPIAVRAAFAAAAAAAGALVTPVAEAQPGTTLFYNNLNGNLNGFTVVSSGGDASIGNETANQGRSLRLRWGAVGVYTDPIDATVPGAELTVWIRRGADSFSENPDAGEDLVIEFRDAGGNWNVIDSYPGNGTPGEIVTPAYTLPAAALHANLSIRFRLTSGSGSNYDYWHVDDIRVTETGPVITVLSYSFEETAWTGAAGEVVENAGSGLDGTVFGGAANDDTSPALATNPGTCRYAEFDGVDDYIEIPDDPAFDMANELTVAAWIYLRSYPSELYTIVSKDWNYEYHVNGAGQVYWWWNDSNGNTRSFTTGASLALNRWYHVAITYASGSQAIYVDGVPWATRNFNGSLRLNDLPLYIGTDWNFISRAFDGYIDEVTLEARSYSQAEVQALRDATHPCATVGAEFTINHDAFGIHCIPETITVDVIDAVAGTPLPSYNAQVELDTQSGYGTWTLLSGGGTLTDAVADDGIALYDWPLGETQAVFQLNYPQGPPVIDIDVFQVSDTGVRDTDAEGPLTFSANGFTVTAAPIGNPPGAFVPFAAAETAAVPFDVHITAYGQTPTDPVCGVIESYTGARNLKFWSEYVNPSSGFMGVDVDGAPVATSEAAAVDQSVTFASGQGQVTVRYDDAGSLRLAMKDDTTVNAELPGGIRGSTAAFVSRPADFLLSAIEDAGGNPNPAAVDATGPVFIAAGAPFRATVTAVDAEGDPTPNFGRESPAASVELEPLLVAPAGGRNPGVGGTGFGGFVGGAATGVDFSWAEVGIVQLRPSVLGGDYLGAGDVVGADSANVGRFVPDRFALALNAPILTTQCTAGGFTYTGEPFTYLLAPEITATAQTTAGSTTENYSGAFFRMTTATLQNLVYAAASGTLDLSGVPSAATDPVVTDATGGIARIRFDAGGTTSLAFSRGMPAAPFPADITLSIDVFDADGVAGAANPAVFGTAGGIAFSAGSEVRYGRLRFVNAVGSELVDLPLPLVAEYYVDANTGFAVNGLDSCTTGVSLSFVAYTRDLNAGETCVLDSGAPGSSGAGCAAAAPLAVRYAEPPAAGDFNLRLAAPGAGNTGTVTVGSDVPVWLRFDWDSLTPGEENPAGVAAFGLYGGQSSQIYLHELF